MRSGTVWLILSLLAGGAFFLGRHEHPERLAVGDTYWYLRQAQIFAGADPATATDTAKSLVCRDITRSKRAYGIEQPPCRSYSVISAPQYVAIFASRPGYPLVAAPFVRFLGPWRGMMLATLLLAMLAAALAHLAITIASGSRLAGFLGTVFFLALPSGWWLSRLLTEGGVAAGYFAVLIGTMLAWRGRRSGLLIILAALAWLFAFRSASGMAGAAAVIGASLIAAPRIGRAAIGAGATGLAATAVWQIIATALDLPGLDATIQDFATSHWSRPLVPDPIGWLIDKNLGFWPAQGGSLLTEPWFVVAFAAAAAVLITRDRLLAAPWLLIGLTGIAMLVAHPVGAEWNRMNMPLWMPVSLAFGVALAGAIHQTEHRITPPAPVSGINPKLPAVAGSAPSGGSAKVHEF